MILSHRSPTGQQLLSSEVKHSQTKDEHASKIELELQDSGQEVSENLDFAKQFFNFFSILVHAICSIRSFRWTVGENWELATD